MVRQIKSKKRITDYGEVFTNRREVNAMLDLVSDEASNITSTFLEPACGNGNFIIEILKRKMFTAQALSGTSWELAINTLKAVSSIYGIDIQADNVNECRERVKAYLIDTINYGLCRYSPLLYEQCFTLLDIILSCNIICGNTLSGKDNQGEAIRVSEWTICNDGLITRRDQLFSDILLGKLNYMNEVIYKTLCGISTSYHGNDKT